MATARLGAAPHTPWDERSIPRSRSGDIPAPTDTHFAPSAILSLVPRGSDLRGEKGESGGGEEGKQFSVGPVAHRRARKLQMEQLRDRLPPEPRARRVHPPAPSLLPAPVLPALCLLEPSVQN